MALAEFALLVPVFALLAVAAMDFGLAFYDKLQLGQAVAQGAQYAFITGGSVQAAQVQAVVQNTIGLSPVTVTVNYTASACYCASGSPATKVAQTCGVNCPNGAPPGKYLDITAGYTYQPIFSAYGLILDPNLAEQATVRVQ